MQKNTLLPFKVATAQSMAATFTTTPTSIPYLDNIAYQINVTTTDSQGTFSVEVSLDYVASGASNGPANAGNWSQLSLSGTPTVAAASDTIVISLNQVPATAIRLKYTSTTAGTGTCDVFITAKGLS